MGRKRRQRSTTIRKRIEKKRREDDKARRKAAKAGGADADAILLAEVPRAEAQACATAIQDLGARLSAAPIRGWTEDDLAGTSGLAWLGDALYEAVETQDDDPLVLEVSFTGQRDLLDKLTALETAAPGLELDWEAGFPTITRAISRAEEPPAEDEDEDEAS